MKNPLSSSRKRKTYSLLTLQYSGESLKILAKITPSTNNDSQNTNNNSYIYAKLFTEEQIYQANWLVAPYIDENNAINNSAFSNSLDMPMISSSFEKNSGEAIVAISQYQNASAIEITIQEGKYVDERLQITFTTIDKIPLIITDNSVYKGTEITLESVPAFML